MSADPVTTRAQGTFLRAFRLNPSGPPPQDWPSPAILRRWLRSPGFKTALRSIQNALRFQTDFVIASAAARAARAMDDPAKAPTAKQLREILRLAHVRQRFNLANPDPDALKSPREH